MTQTAITKRLRDWGKAVRTTAFKFSLLFTLASSFVTGISMYTLYRSAEKESAEGHTAKEKEKLRQEPRNRFFAARTDVTALYAGGDIRFLWLVPEKEKKGWAK